MRKRLLSSLLVLCMVLTLPSGLTLPVSAASEWDGTIPAANAAYPFSGGAGTPDDPYRISTAADLAQLAANVNSGIEYVTKTFEQTADIDLNPGVTFAFVADTGLVTVSKGANTFYLGTGRKGDASGANTVFDTTGGTAGMIYSVDTATTAGTDTIGLHPWTPIGTSAGQFLEGPYDGQGYAISGMYINNAATNYQGLFGYAGRSIYNIGVSSSYVLGKNYTGGIAGFTGSIIKNCYNTGIVCGSDYVGGIAGYADFVMDNNYNAGSVIGAAYVGGVTGEINGQVRYCYSTNTVTGTSDAKSVVGNLYWGFVDSCGTIDSMQHLTAGSPANCDSDQTLMAGLTSGTSTLLEALNAYVTLQNISGLYTWKADAGASNGGYPRLGAAFVPETVPDAPTIGTATAGNGQASVTFAPPGSNGGAAISGYTVTSSPGGLTGTGAGSPITVTGLTNGTAYTFSVTATNARGTGAASDASNSVTPGVTPTISMSASALTAFASQTAGYAAAPAAQTVTVTNTGNQAITLTQPTATKYAIGALSTTALAVGGTATFTVQPLSGLASGTHNETISVSGSGGASASVSALFTVVAATPPPSAGGSSSYTPPAPVVRIDNGGSTTGSNISQLVSGGKTLTVDGANGTKLVFDTEALRGISNQVSGDIKVEMKDVSPVHQDTLPGKQVFSLTVSSGNGTLTQFGGPVTVSLPYALKDGEKADEVTVWYLAGDGTRTEVPCAYDPATKLATFTVTHFSLYVVGVEKPWVTPFADVKEGDPFFNAVAFVSRSGVMRGLGGATFSPDTNVTRGMFVTMLWRMEKEPAAANTRSFTDVADGKWYAKAVAWAEGTGIATGYAGKFSPENLLTREQLAAILHRYAIYKKTVANAADSLSAYTDKPSDWALSDMKWAVGEGLLAGNNGRLDPKNGSTRAQAATIVQHFTENTTR